MTSSRPWPTPPPGSGVSRLRSWASPPGAPAPQTIWPSCRTRAAPGRPGPVDRATGRRRRVTDEPVGVEEVARRARRPGRVVAGRRRGRDAGGGWRRRPDGRRPEPLRRTTSRPAGARASRSPRRARSRSGSTRTRTTGSTSSRSGGAPEPPPRAHGPHRRRAARSRRASEGSRPTERSVCLRHSRARRHHPRGPAGGRRGGRDGRRADRRGLEPRPRRVEPGAGRSSTALHVGARRVRATRDLGPRDRRTTRPGRRPARAP